MSKCSCQSYDHLSLDTGSIFRRLSQIIGSVDRLQSIAEHREGEHQLLNCSDCGQYWQRSRAWIWNNTYYVFRVPEILGDEWLKEPYLPPDEMVYFNKCIGDYLAPGNLSERELECSIEGCQRSAASQSVMCVWHHVEWMQEKGHLSKVPVGRLFLPYSYDEERMKFDLVGEI
jgi:hypothetical protein